MDNELLSSFSQTIFENSADIGIDFLEIALDELTENETIKEIPVVGTIVKLGKTAIAINDRRLIKKMLIFIQEVNSGNIPEEKLAERCEELKKNPKKKQKELEYVIAILDKQIEYEKSKLFAKLYIAYLKRDITWECFNCFSDLLDRLVLYDLDVLLEVYNKYSYGAADHADVAQMSRLNSLGLVQYFNGTVVSIGNRANIKGRISGTGKMFCKVLFEQ